MVMMMVMMMVLMMIKMIKMIKDNASSPKIEQGGWAADLASE